MKKYSGFLFFILSSFMSIGQCSTVSVQVSSSDTSYVQLYNAGFFNIPSGFDNVCEWQVLSFTGDTIHQETTSGEFNDQSSVIFDHEVSILDSMKATIVITNSIEGIVCTMNDTLYWKETEVLPGAFIGNWDVLSSNGGVEEDIATSTKVVLEVNALEVYPSPVSSFFNVKSATNSNSFTIYNANGEFVATYSNVDVHERIDVSEYSSGLYFVRFWNEKNKYLSIQKVIKI